MKKLFLLLSLSWPIPQLAFADIYLHIDEHGHKYYSDIPQPGAEIYRSESSLQPIPQPQLPKLYPDSKSTKAKKSQSNKKHQAKRLAQQQKHCERLERKIERLTDKLRGRHSNTQGNRWRQQRRELSDQRYRQCR